MAQFSAAPQSGPLASTSTSSTSPAASSTASASIPSSSEWRAGAARGLHAAPALVGPDEPWASGQRKRYLNSLQTSELAA